MSGGGRTGDGAGESGGEAALKSRGETTAKSGGEAALESRGLSTVVSRGAVTIDIEQCKGCELCIPACPPGVLAMSSAFNDRGVPYPELSPGCTGCGACLLVCPDFCFAVYRYDEPVEHEVVA